MPKDEGVTTPANHGTPGSGEAAPAAAPAFLDPAPTIPGAPSAGAFWFQASLLALVAAAVYSSALDAKLVLDSVEWIALSPRIRQLWPLPRGILTAGRPTLELSLILNHQWSGAEPWSYALVNVLVHLASATTLMAVLGRLFRSPRLARAMGPSASGLAFAAALLWLAHPLNTQSVTYIIQRSESIMGLFFLLSLHAAQRFATDRRPTLWLLLSGVFCALGMGSKIVALAAPPLALLMGLLFFGEGFRQRLRGHAWLFGLAGLGMLAAGAVLTNFGRMLFQGNSAGFGVPGVSPLRYLASQPAILLHYLRLSFWPDVLCLDYGWPLVERFSQAAVPGAVVGGMLAATLVGLLRRSPWAFVGAWCFLILAPTSSLMPLYDLAAEHRMYLPLAALVTGVVVGTHLLLAGAQRSLGLGPAAGRAAAVVLLLAAGAALGARTVARNLQYHDEYDIVGQTVAVAPNNLRMRNNYGYMLLWSPRPEALAEGIGHLEYVLARTADPTLARIAGVNLALGHIAARRPKDAIRVLDQAESGLSTGSLDGTRDLARARRYRGLAWRDLGDQAQAAAKAATARGDQAGAKQQAEGAVTCRTRAAALFAEAATLAEDAWPEDPDYPFDLGRELLALGRAKDAVAPLRRAAGLNPGHPDLRGELGWALCRAGDLREGLPLLAEAMRERGDARTRLRLAEALLDAGRGGEAGQHLRAVLAADPGNEEARRLAERAGGN